MARIGIDLDGVCYDFTQAFCDYVGHLNTANHWKFYEDWGWQTAEFLAACSGAIADANLFRHDYVIPGAVEGIKALREMGHTIHFVTDRASLDYRQSGKIKDATIAWLADNDIKYETLDFEGDKARVVKVRELDYFLDDKIENYEAVSKITTAFLFEQPWNACAPVGYDTVLDWPDFVRVVCEPMSEPVVRWDLAPGEVRLTSKTGGQKGQKLARLGSLDPQALLKVAEVAGFGEQKYARLNYMNGYDWSLTFDAGMRHRLAFWSGEDLDPESGLPHLAHAAWHDLCLLAFFMRNLGTDDRYRDPSPSEDELKRLFGRTRAGGRAVSVSRSSQTTRNVNNEKLSGHTAEKDAGFDQRFRAVEQALRGEVPPDAMLTDDEIDGIAYAVLRSLEGLW